MTAKEYLRQAYRLEHKIRILKKDVEDMRELATSLSSPDYEEHYQTSRNIHAPFEKSVEYLVAYEKEADAKLVLLLNLRKQIKEVIGQMKDEDERLILYYHYLDNLSFGRIAEEMDVDERTVRRWHSRALSHVVLPQNLIII